MTGQWQRQLDRALDLSFEDVTLDVWDYDFIEKMAESACHHDWRPSGRQRFLLNELDKKIIKRKKECKS